MASISVDEGLHPDRRGPAGAPAVVYSGEEGALPLRVLFVTGCTGRGGAGHSLHYLCRYVDRSVIEPLVVSPTAGVIGPRLDEIGVRRFEATRLHERSYEQRFRRDNALTRALSVVRNAWDSVVFSVQLAGLARRLDVDLIYANHMLVKIIVTIAGALSRRPVFFHCRTIYANALERAFYVTAARLPHVRRIVAVSEASARNFRAVAHKVRVVHNGVPVDDVVRRAGSTDARAALGVEAGRPLVGFVGRFVRWKGIDVLLDAAEIVAREHPDVVFALVGDVPVGASETLEDYRARVRARGLADNVVFAGFQTDPAPYLAAFDVLAVPSIRPDPCPRVVVESMAVGTPVVGSDAGGIPEVVVDGRTGFVSPPGDAPAMAERLARLLGDEELRKRLGEEAACVARAEYDAATVAAHVQRIVTEAVGAPAARG